MHNKPQVYTANEPTLIESPVMAVNFLKTVVRIFKATISLTYRVCGVLGIKHQQSDLTTYLGNVRKYMPKPHRGFLSFLNGDSVRTLAAKSNILKKGYNHCITLILEFRRFHLQLTAKYIASKVNSEKGSGGTEFMKWLKLMTHETEAQLL